MKKTITLLVVGFALFSCAHSEEIKETNEEFPVTKNYAKPLPLSNAEAVMQKKISELGNNSMNMDYAKMTEVELENLATNHLIETSVAVLKENGYTNEKIESEFKTKNEVIHKALYYYSLKVNNR